MSLPAPSARCAIARPLYLEVESEPRWEGQMIDAEVISHLASYGLKPVVRDVQQEAWRQYNDFLRMRGVRASRNS